MYGFLYIFLALKMVVPPENASFIFPHPLYTACPPFLSFRNVFFFNPSLWFMLHICLSLHLPPPPSPPPPSPFIPLAVTQLERERERASYLKICGIACQKVSSQAQLCTYAMIGLAVTLGHGSISCVR